jgi:hypothetical protein
MVIAGNMINDLENSCLLFKKRVIVKNNIPDKANDNAVVNFIVTHIGKILFKISMSRIHPIITTIPTISKEIPDTVVIRLLKEFLFCVSR